MTVRYASRDDVLSALDLSESARLSAQVDRALDGASRAVEELCGRDFAPWVGTRTIRGGWGGGRVYLDRATECTELTGVTVDGAAVTDYWLGPQTSATVEHRAPFTYLDLDRASGSTLTLAGTFGACSAAEPVTTLDDAVTAGAGQLAVTDAARVSPGALLKIDSEWIIVVGRAFVDTGQALTAPLDEHAAAVQLSVADPTALHVGETFQLGGEWLRVESVTGAGVTVERAVAGSTLTDHPQGATLYAPRLLIVERGACGSTATGHDDGATVRRHAPPGPIVDLTIGETLNRLAQESSSYARTIGSAEFARNASGRGLAELREQVRASYGRGLRTVAI